MPQLTKNVALAWVTLKNCIFSYYYEHDEQTVPAYKFKSFLLEIEVTYIIQLCLRCIFQRGNFPGKENIFPRKPSDWQKHLQIMDIILVMLQKSCKLYVKNLKEMHKYG